ncbi:MAG: thiamine pyrophosphate-dependent dehydrogenase E1 component subunit alpha [Thermoleophilia bacterium]|nr:thiamine pyrophosphate-dependent dehydrogenase E1 component subunit alpha [Thermoleophilia bacterium]
MTTQGAGETLAVRSIDTQTLLALHRKMVITREAEQTWSDMLQKREFYLMGHFGTGQEAVGVGLGHALEPDDYLFPTHRGIAEYVGKGMAQNDIWAEYYAKTAGPAGGKGGLHLSDYRLGLIGLVGSLGADYAISAGAALSTKLRGSDRVVVVSFGEGTSSQADLGSAMNVAALWKLPLIFAMTNNEWCELSPASEHVCTPFVAPRAEGYGIPWSVVDGNDVVAVYSAVRTVVERVRAEAGPYFLEFKSYRVGPHWSGDDGSYMCQEDVCAWQERDPIAACERRLLEEGMVSAGEISGIKKAAQAEVAAAIERARGLADPTYEEMLAGVYSGAPAGGGAREVS